MSGIYPQRHPENAVFYRVFFHYFERFLHEYESHFEKEYGFLRTVIKDIEEKHLGCDNPVYGFTSIRCFIEEKKTIDRIIRHLKVTFEVEWLPQPHNAQQYLLMEAEENREFF